MAINKERLEQLIEQEKVIFSVVHDEPYSYAEEIHLDSGCDIDDQWLIWRGRTTDFNDLYETQAEAEWHADNDAEQTYYFQPPMELKVTERYDFITSNGIAFIMRLTDCYIVYANYMKLQTCKTYPEAVAYARKLFKGEA